MIIGIRCQCRLERMLSESKNIYQNSSWEYVTGEITTPGYIIHDFGIVQETIENITNANENDECTEQTIL